MSAINHKIITMSDNGILTGLAVGLSITALAVGAAVLATKFKGDTLATELWLLRKKIKLGWIGNPALEHLKMSSEKTLFFPKYQNMQFYVKIVASNKFTKKKAESDPSVDPFARENISPLFIADLSETHALLYNKFHLVPYHVLIITKDFIMQNTPLVESDFAASLKVMKALTGFVFFNSAPNAGASQEHKHLQAIPYSSYPNQSVPIDTLIEQAYKDDLKGDTYFTLPQFNFKHIFYRFDKSITKGISTRSLPDKAKLLEEVYKGCLRKLNNESLATAYNMVLTKHWMFLVLRKTELALNKVKINAVGFTGSFAVKSDEDYHFILAQDPFTILTLVSYPL